MDEILINKNYKSYDYLSRYITFPYYYNTYDNKYIYGTTSQMNTDVSYVLHEITENETLDSIALDYYNNPTFFWVLADFNQIQDPYTKLNVGDRLKIPSLSSIGFKD